MKMILNAAFTASLHITSTYIFSTHRLTQFSDINENFLLSLVNCGRGMDVMINTSIQAMQYKINAVPINMPQTIIKFLLDTPCVLLLSLCRILHNIFLNRLNIDCILNLVKYPYGYIHQRTYLTQIECLS